MGVCMITYTCVQVYTYARHTVVCMAGIITIGWVIVILKITIARS